MLRDYWQMMITHPGKEFKQTLDLIVVLNCTQSQMKTTNSTSLNKKQPAELSSSMITLNTIIFWLTVMMKITIVIVIQFYSKNINWCFLGKNTFVCSIWKPIQVQKLKRKDLYLLIDDFLSHQSSDLFYKTEIKTATSNFYLQIIKKFTIKNIIFDFDLK